MPGTAVTKSVVANEAGGKKREEIFVDIIEKISVTFSSSVCPAPQILFPIIKFEVVHFLHHGDEGTINQMFSLYVDV